MERYIWLPVLLCIGFISACAGSPAPQAADADASQPGDAASPLIRKLSVALSTDCTTSVDEAGVETGSCANGCKVVQKPDGYPIIVCPKKEKLQCTAPPDDSKRCWAAPQFVCGPAGAALTWGCSADGSKCCAFESLCQPCGWVNCMKPTGATAAACSVPHSDPQWEVLCPVGLREQMRCEVCAGGLVCPAGTPTNIVTP